MSTRGRLVPAVMTSLPSLLHPLFTPASIQPHQRHATVHHSCALMHIPKQKDYYK